MGAQHEPDRRSHSEASLDPSPIGRAGRHGEGKADVRMAVAGGREWVADRNIRGLDKFEMRLLPPATRFFD